MENSNTKAQYVTNGKLYQLERHGDLFRTKVVLNIIPGSNINIKEIIGKYECFLLTRSLFDINGLPNHGSDVRSDLLHTLSNCIDGAWIDSWWGKLDVTVIDAIIFHLPISTKFKSFQMLSTSFLNHIV